MRVKTQPPGTSQAEGCLKAQGGRVLYRETGGEPPTEAVKTRHPPAPRGPVGPLAPCSHRRWPPLSAVGRHYPPLAAVRAELPAPPRALPQRGRAEEKRKRREGGGKRGGGSPAPLGKGGSAAPLPGGGKTRVGQDAGNRAEVCEGAP